MIIINSNYSYRVDKSRIEKSFIHASCWIHTKYLEYSHQESQKIQHLAFQKPTLFILTTHFTIHPTSKVLYFLPLH